MSNMAGTFSINAPLTTTLSTGTAGVATETNSLSPSITFGPTAGAGLVIGDLWSNLYATLTGTTTLDLTNLTGPGGRVVNLSALRCILAWNCDPTSANVVEIGPGASNPLLGPFVSAAAFLTIPGGFPSAGYSQGKPVGNPFMIGGFNSAGWAVSGGAKTIQLVVPSGTVTNFVIFLF